MYLEIKETTMCFGNSNEKEPVALDNRIYRKAFLLYFLD